MKKKKNNNNNNNNITFPLIIPFQNLDSATIADYLSHCDFVVGKPGPGMVIFMLFFTSYFFI